MGDVNHVRSLLVLMALLAERWPSAFLTDRIQT
jgi:hypothetical protein